MSLAGPAFAGERPEHSYPQEQTVTLSLADQSTAAPPAWCPENEYHIFSGSTAYSDETWQSLLSLREYAAAGNTAFSRSADITLFNRYNKLKLSADPGIQFELGLIYVKLAMNALQQGLAPASCSHFEFAASYTDEEDAKYLCYLWDARMSLATDDISTGLEGGLRWYAGAIESLLGYEQFRFEDIYTCPLAQLLPAQRIDQSKALIFVTLDGKLVHPRSVRLSSTYLDTTTAQARQNRTMVPVRRLAELMGATVDYDAATKRITITRAADTIVLVLDSTTAYQNGTPFQMDVAPYAENNRTYIPLRYIAEFFHQKVDWNASQQQVIIKEDKSAAEGSNLESWALAMGLLLNYENNPWEAHLFGGKYRFGTGPVGGAVSNRVETTGPDFGRSILSESWDITDRQALLLSAATLSESKDAWDLFRVSHLAQWGYLAGYVTYEEALCLVDPAAQKVARSYRSWKDAYEAYLTGYCRWAGLDSTSVWDSDRGELYQTLLADPELAALLDDGLFRTGVLGMTCPRPATTYPSPEPPLQGGSRQNKD